MEIGMGAQRRRRDQIWNPPSRGVDISAIFVIFAAGPLLLPLIGAQIAVIAFATPLALCLFAAWRCALAARRSQQDSPVWWLLGSATLTAALASIVALASADSDVAFYIGTVASALLAIAMLGLARRCMVAVPVERAVDG